MNQNLKITGLIDDATSTDLSRPNLDLNKRVCEEINSRADV